MYKTLIDEIGRLIKGALPFAIVSTDGKGLAGVMSYRQPQDAWNAGHKLIFVKDGTYSAQAMTSLSGVTIIGSASAILDGGTTAHALNMASCTYINIIGLAYKTTGGGGSSYSPIYADGSTNYCNFISSLFLDSDAEGPIAVGTGNLFLACKMMDGDSNGITLYGPKNMIVASYVHNSVAGYGIAGGAGTADNSLLAANIDHSIGGMYLNGGADDSLIAANLTDVGPNNNSTGSTVSANETF
jgi:hypothetical protein